VTKIKNGPSTGDPIKAFSFTMIPAGADVLTPEMGDSLEAAGFDDGTSSSCNGVVS
jgi:hypothetical protein